MSELPQAAAAKVFRLQESAKRANEAANAAAATIAELERMRADLAYKQDVLADRRDELGKKQLIAVAKEIEKIEGDLAASNESQAQSRERAQNDAAILKLIDRWLTTLSPGLDLVMFDVSTLKLPESGDLVKAIEETREEIAGLKLTRRAIHSAPEPLRNIRDRAREFVAQLAAGSCPKVEVGRGDIRVSFGMEAAGDHRFLRILAWVEPDQLAARVEAELKKVAPDEKKAMTKAEKRSTLADIDRAELELERIDELLVEEARARNIHVLRRTKADATAVLGIAVRGAASKRKAA